MTTTSARATARTTGRRTNHRGRTPAHTRTMAATAALLLAGLGTGLAAGPAVGAIDDPTEGGLWYYTVPGFPEIHASGVTGEGITVAVIDGPIYPDSPDLAGTNLILPEASFCDADRDGIPDEVTSRGPAAGHATTLTALIIGTGAGLNGEPGVRGVAPDATVRLYVRTSTGGNCRLDGQPGDVLGIEQAIDDGADIINLSYSGPGARLEPSEEAAIARAQRTGVIVVAASNNQSGTELGWPALANGVIAVEAAGVDRALHPGAVTHPRLTVVAPGVDIRGLVPSTDWQRYGTNSGSSMATAWTSGVLALAWSAYPEATANQMIQALLRTTGQSDGNLTRVDDQWGYGMVNARNLVAIDPTTLPDVNPLVRDDPEAQPSYDQIMGAEPDPEPTPEPTATVPDPEPTQAAPAPTDTDPAGTGLPAALLIALVAALVLAGAITSVILLRRRTNPATTGTVPTTATGSAASSGPPPLAPPPPGPPPPPPGPPGPPVPPTQPRLGG